MKKKELPKVKPVKLKPLWGMEPGLWLTILYSIVLVLLLFFIGILPDLIHPSKRVTFTSAVNNAAVYLDDNYIGGTTFTTKVSSGKHTVRYEVNENILESFDIKVSKPVFFAWLFPRRMTVNSSALLTKDAYQALVSEFFEDLSIYSMVLEYDKVHLYPNLYSNFANNIKASLSVCSDYEKVLRYASCFATTNVMKEDCKNAHSILGLNYSDPTETSKSFTKPSWTEDSVYGIEGYKCKDFSISRQTITEKQFMDFVAANPKWASSNVENLISEGLVDEYYLRGVQGDSSKPVRNVSYYAAKAYCQWLSFVSGKNVCLPTEEQWYLASLGAEQNYQKTLKSISIAKMPVAMLGGVWEITDTYSVPVNTDGIQEFLASYNVEGEVVVKGGSYINNNVNAKTKGSFPKNSCSDYMGFRIIWN